MPYSKIYLFLTMFALSVGCNMGKAPAKPKVIRTALPADTAKVEGIGGTGSTSSTSSTGSKIASTPLGSSIVVTPGNNPDITTNFSVTNFDPMKDRIDLSRLAPEIYVAGQDGAFYPGKTVMVSWKQEGSSTVVYISRGTALNTIDETENTNIFSGVVQKNGEVQETEDISRFDISINTKLTLKQVDVAQLDRSNFILTDISQDKLLEPSLIWFDLKLPNAGPVAQTVPTLECNNQASVTRELNIGLGYFSPITQKKCLSIDSVSNVTTVRGGTVVVGTKIFTAALKGGSSDVPNVQAATFNHAPTPYLFDLPAGAGCNPGWRKFVSYNKDIHCFRIAGLDFPLTSPVLSVASRSGAITASVPTVEASTTPLGNTPTGTTFTVTANLRDNVTPKVTTTGLAKNEKPTIASESQLWEITIPEFDPRNDKLDLSALALTFYVAGNGLFKYPSSDRAVLAWQTSEDGTIISISTGGLVNNTLVDDKFNVRTDMTITLTGMTADFNKNNLILIEHDPEKFLEGGLVYLSDGKILLIKRPSDVTEPVLDFDETTGLGTKSQQFGPNSYLFSTPASGACSAGWRSSKSGTLYCYRRPIEDFPVPPLP